MASSILRETGASAHDVEAELQALTSAKKSAARNLVIVLGSLFLFILIGAVNAGPLGILILVAVLLVHELGHLAAMRVFGYRDVQMLFIPFLGAAVSGTEASPSGVKRALVSLCGPAPGIALGVICAALFLATGQRAFMVGARAFLIVNTFNLLPLVPLDGGHCVEAVLFSRRPMLRALSIAGAAVVLALIAVATRGVVLGIIAILALASVRNAYFSSKLAAQIKRELAAQGEADSLGDRVPSRCLERLIPALEARLPEGMQTAPANAAAVRNVWNMVWFKPPSAPASAGLLLLYLACLGTGVLAIGAEASIEHARSQSRESGPVGNHGVNDPALSARSPQPKGNLQDDELTALRERAEEGDAAAQVNLGAMYALGKGVPRNSAEAVKWFGKAAEQDSAMAQVSLGVMYGDGQGVPQNYAEAAKWYRKAADQGNAIAQTSLATLYANGHGVPQNYAEAAKWYRKAADQGYAIAQFNLGNMYVSGRGVTRDEAEALKWYRRAEEQVQGDARFLLLGRDVLQDDAEVVKGFRKAAEEGDASAQHRLGLMYEQGRGVRTNDVEAAKWYRKAAEQGYLPAVYDLGFMYASGKGVTRDAVEAYKWWSVAAFRTQGDLQKRYVDKRDAIGRTLTSAQAAEAKKRAREWIEAFRKERK